MNIHGTNTLFKNLDAFRSEKRFIINQGGTRSGKTIAILQMLIILALEKVRTIDVVRNTWASLANTAYQDFINILKSLDYYDEEYHNMSKHQYTFPNGSTIRFYGADNAHSLRGAGRDILFINEADKLNYEQYFQLNIRTRYKLILDFNPSEPDGWIYELMNDEKAITIHSTYLDAIDFLPQVQIDEIEKLKNADERYYQTYALGQRPTKSRRVYIHFKEIDVLHVPSGLVVYGLDLGWNDPSVLVKVTLDIPNMIAYVDELMYSSGMTSQDIIKHFDSLALNKTDKIYADHQLQVTEDIKRSKYHIVNADKKDRMGGINTVKKWQVFVTTRSTNIWKEYKSYNYKTKNDEITDDIIEYNDHAMDAIRYAIHSATNKSQRPNYSFH